MIHRDFTSSDSSHLTTSQLVQVSRRDSPEMREFFRSHCTDWVASKLPLGTPVREQGDGIPCVSAGHVKHEYTTACALADVVRYCLAAIAPRAAPPGSSSAVECSGSHDATAGAVDVVAELAVASATPVPASEATVREPADATAGLPRLD